MSAVAQERNLFVPGVRSRVPWEEYSALPGVSISRLKELARSPMHYLYRLEHPKQSKAMSLGTAAHTATLEPERFIEQFAIWGERTKSGNLRPRNGKDWEAFEFAHSDKTIITADERDDAVAIAAAVRSNPVAMHYLASGDPEVTMQWASADGMQFRSRADWLTTVAPYNKPDSQPVPHVVGLKTARDCRHFIFSTAAAKLGYHMQWGFYFDAWKALKGGEPRMIEIVVESEPPHAVAVYFIPDDIIDQGRDEYQKLLLRLAECESTGHFPGPQEAEEALTLPSWVYESTNDISELGLEE